MPCWKAVAARENVKHGFLLHYHFTFISVLYLFHTDMQSQPKDGEYASRCLQKPSVKQIVVIAAGEKSVLQIPEVT